MILLVLSNLCNELFDLVPADFVLKVRFVLFIHAVSEIVDLLLSQLLLLYNDSWEELRELDIVVVSFVQRRHHILNDYPLLPLLQTHPLQLVIMTEIYSGMEFGILRTGGGGH